MTLLEVKKTVSYAGFFNSRLTLKQLHLWLISPNKHSFKEVANFVSKHPAFQKQLISKHDPKKTMLVNQKINQIKKLILVFKFIPSIKLVALTGSLSINNPKKQDDIDLMIVTSPHTLWLTRPLVILFTSLLSSRRKPKTKTTNNQICINLWLDQTSLTVPKNKQNLYTAHEVLQVKPLFDRGGVYQQFIKANSWTKKHLATAYATILTKRGPTLTGAPPDNGGAGPLAIGPKEGRYPQILRGGTRQLNLLFFHLQHLYMKPKITNEYITPHAAYFHPRSLYPQIKKSLSVS